MSSVPANLAHDVADILTVMVAQIRTLSEAETKALLAGDAEFKVVPRKRAPASTTAPASARAAKAAPSTVDADPEQVRRALDGCDSEAAATTYLQGLKLSAAAAKTLAVSLGLRLPARPTGPAIIAEIVRVFVSGRLNAATVQGL